MSAALFFSVVIGTAVWFGLIGHYGLQEWVLGTLVVASGGWLTVRLSDAGMLMPYKRLTGSFWSFLTYVAKEMLPAMLFQSLRLAAAAAYPRSAMQDAVLGAIIAVELPKASNEALLLLSFGIAFSPDRQVVLIDEERKIIYVHALVSTDAEHVRQEIASHFEHYVRKAVP